MIALLAPVQAGLRFPCSTLTFQRLDPVVEPGSSPSSHVHHIVGGNAFNASMTGDVASRASCKNADVRTTCETYTDCVLQYFRHHLPDGGGLLKLLDCYSVLQASYQRLISPCAGSSRSAFVGRIRWRAGWTYGLLHPIRSV